MILLRHGQSEFNLHFSATRRDPGIVDPRLTELGHAQAAEAARRLAGERITRIIASPYTRALQTAAPLAKALGVTVLINPIVRERYAFACDIGTPRTELERAWPEHDFSTIDEVWWPPIEEPADFGDRARRAVPCRNGRPAGLVRHACGQPLGLHSVADRQERDERPVAALRPERRASRADRLAGLIDTRGTGWRRRAIRATRPRRTGVSARACSDTEIVMSETTAPPQTAGQPHTPPLVVNIQYVKDLSFEVPGAPQVFTQLRAQPQVNINLDVQARRVQEGQNVFEVSIMIRAEAHEAPAAQSGNGQSAAVPPTVFVAELTYAGVFTLTGLPDNAIEPVLLVECPRILFPFARNILSDVTRDGGFPPVLLQPIDFVALWQARRAQAQPAQPPAAYARRSPDPAQARSQTGSFSRATKAACAASSSSLGTIGRGARSPVCV